MAHEPNAFENQIFDHYRTQAKTGKIINKDTINLDEKPVVSPIRYNTRNKE